MSRLTIVEGNSNDKDNVRAIMVKGEKGDKGDNGEITYSDVVDNLTSTETQLPLSANQGKQLKDLIDNNKTELEEKIKNNILGTLNFRKYDSLTIDTSELYDGVSHSYLQGFVILYPEQIFHNLS